MHRTGKTLLRGVIDSVHKHYEPVITYKKENGWYKDHVLAQVEAWKVIEALYDMPSNAIIGGGWNNNQDDRNRVMFRNVLDIFWLMQDEDSAYDIPWLIYLKWIHEHWDRFEKSAEQAYQMANFGNFYRDLIEYAKPLDNIDDEDDKINDELVDFVALERNAEKIMEDDNNGMGK